MKKKIFKKEIFSRIGLVLSSAVIALGIFELILAYPLYYYYRGNTNFSFYSRPLMHAIFLKDPKIGLVSPPNLNIKGNSTHTTPNAPRASYYNDIVTDEHGFRYKGKLSKPKPSGETRVFSLGGSTTYGSGSPTELTYPQQLETLINKPDIRVINAGLGAFRSIHLLLLYKHKLRSLSPDIITIYSGWNDFEDSMYAYWKPKHPHGHALMTQMKLGSLPFSRSALVWTLGKMYYSSKNFNRLEYVDEHQALSQKYITTANARGWQEEYESNIQGLIDLAKIDGVTPVIIIFPSPEFENAPEEAILFSDKDLNMVGRWEGFVLFLRNIRKIQRELAAKNDIPLIDVNAPFEKMNGDYKEKFKLFKDRMHLTSEGNKLIAETMLEPILKVSEERSGRILEVHEGLTIDNSLLGN